MERERIDRPSRQDLVNSHANEKIPRPLQAPSLSSTQRNCVDIDCCLLVVACLQCDQQGRESSHFARSLNEFSEIVIVPLRRTDMLSLRYKG
jgi:hypothetical protein